MIKIHTVIFLEGRLQPKEWIKLVSAYRNRHNLVYVVRKDSQGVRSIDTARYILRDDKAGGNALFKLIRATKTKVVIYRIKRTSNDKDDRSPVATYEEETLIRRLITSL